MLGVLTGFAIIAVVIAAGYLIARTGVVGADARRPLSRLAFFALNPCLLLTTLAAADVRVLFSSLLLVSALAAALTAGAYLLIARLVLRRPGGETVIGTLSASYVNAGNIGIPVAAYVLGDPALSAPVVLLQVVVITPVVLVILDAMQRGRVSVWRILVGAFSNPIVIASMLGVLISAFQIPVPGPVLEPFRLIGAAAVPIVLIAFGMSLRDQRPLAPGSGRAAILAASALKLAFMPAVAWALGSFVFVLRPAELFAVVVLAALPTAQNVFTYAQRYEVGETVARDSAVVTTLAALPILMAIAALLAPV